MCYNGITITRVADTCRTGKFSLLYFAVRQIPVRHFPPLRLRLSFSSPAISSPANSAIPRQLAAIWENWTQMHNYKPSPIQRHQNGSCSPTPSWRNWAHLWHLKAWRTDRQTDRQTDKNSIGGGWNASPTKLGTVIDDLEHVLEPRKLLWVRCIVLLLGGAEDLGNSTPST